VHPKLCDARIALDIQLAEKPMETVAVLDFETTGLSPSWGDRPTEIAVALVRNGRIVDRFQSLMNPGRRIPADVVQLTGITNEMVAREASVAKVMRDAALFVGRTPIVAHNASFDKKFWEAELAQLSLQSTSVFACTMLLSRRLYPHSPSHRLSTLVEVLGLPRAGRAHRAMADAEMASHLWCRIQSDVTRTYGIQSVHHELLTRAQSVPKAHVPVLFRSCARGA
jgi:DNA polymerase-3 subunit epsilon